MAKTKMMGSRI